MRTPDDIYDEWLVLRCQSGDSQAFAILVQRWQPRLLRLAMRLLNEEAEAEDVVQSTWVVAIGKIGSIKDPGAFRPWLFRIAANKCADLIRGRQVRRRREKHLDVGSFSGGSYDSKPPAIGKADHLLELREALRDLDSDKREILKLHYLKGMSIEQIARSLSLPTGTVKSRLYYARQKLRQIIEGEKHE